MELPISLALALLVQFTMLRFSVGQSDPVTDALCEDPKIASCKDCIRAHPDCTWCLAGAFNATIKRCRSVSKFKETGDCQAGKLVNTTGDIDYPQNKDFSDAMTSKKDVIQLKPQKIDLSLRRKETRKFNITFKKVSDYPVDLYYVMDLSNSMKDDLAVLKKLGETLATDIQSNVTQDIQLGFGTFVDKVMMPFTSTAETQLRNPCFKNSEGGSCAPPFGFKHQQKISDNLTAFELAVEGTKISGNIDSPEGGFDALMQIAVCTEQIGWRNDSTHLVVFTTDASFHMALDGKLAAILEMNDLQCHLEVGANKMIADAMVYSKSKEQDYPSIGQLSHVFNKYKIQPIFAVTEEVKTLYDGLKQLIPNSHVDQLAKDSSNIIAIIKEAYNKLKGKLEMRLEHNTNLVDIKYRVLCPSENDWKSSSLKCENITINSQVVYEFEMTAKECPEDDNPVIMSFTSSSLRESVEIKVDFKCDCDCSKEPIQNSDMCSMNGSLVCGICNCYSPHEGAKCQCTREKEDESLIEKCKKTTTSEICSGNGQCECGICQCNVGFSNTFCQCSNKGCPKDDNGLCGGSERGSCHNCNNDGKCTCKGSWTIDPNIATCSCNEKLCKAENDTRICSGQGICNCKRCLCNDTTRYSGEFCEICIHPDCKPDRRECEGSGMKKCALCVHDAQRQRENMAASCGEQCKGIDYQSVTNIPDCSTCKDKKAPCWTICGELNTTITPPQKCFEQLANTECDIKYEVVWKKTINDYILLVKEFNKETDCREPINPIMIVLPIVAGIVLLGLLALAIWKVYQTIRDKKEWENFEKEMKQSRWTKGQNPIFQKPFTKFQNPTYQGH